jgi:hypothetical protein
MGRDPKNSYSYNGHVYGPDQPEGFTVADLDKINPTKKSEGGTPVALGSSEVKTPSGDVVNQMNATPTDTGEVTKEGGVVSHEASAAQHDGSIQVPAATSVPKSEEELEGMSKSDLEAEAKRRGIEVKRQDGESGAPTKADYVAALAKA